MQLTWKSGLKVIGYSVLNNFHYTILAQSSIQRFEDGNLQLMCGFNICSCISLYETEQFYYKESEESLSRLICWFNLVLWTVVKILLLILTLYFAMS